MEDQEKGISAPTGGKAIAPYRRKKIRFLLVFYDFLLLLVSIFVIFILHPSIDKSIPATTVLIHSAIAFAFIFGCRFLFGVYLQIWRTGKLRSAACLFFADVTGGALYLLSRLTPWVNGISFIHSLAFVGVNLLLCMAERLCYYVWFQLARRDSKSGHILKKMLQIVTLSDVDSADPSAVMRISLESNGVTGPINELQQVIRQFAIRGEVVSYKTINKGYINRTYEIVTRSENDHTHKYILQRINTNVFKDPDALMHNFTFVTEHLHGKIKLPGSKGRSEHDCGVPMVRPTKDGCSFLKTDSGCWRILTFIDDSFGMDIPERPEDFYYAGVAFGMFIREMSDVDLSEIETVIPNFHNTGSRYRDLEAAIAADPVGRVANVEKEIAFYRARAGKFSRIADALEAGKIPTRICHSDCNLNNVLFDKKTRLPVAIIDLDTVMPSTPLYDYGDSMRIGTNTAKDDEKDLSKVSCDLSLYELYARGYLESCGDMLTREELELLPYSSLIITSEDGIRFLMDYVNGDTYYQIFYPEQNLDRCRTQLTLLADMEKKLPEIKRILKKIYRELGLTATLDESADW